jgi:NAD(P)-dependent dehydrogenase (short-subunit alcohol dehydrogenase family)
MDSPSIETLFDFRGKVAVVTGAGIGIGAGIARRFGQAGAGVVVHFRSSRAGARAVAADVERSGRPAISVQADLTQRTEVERLFAQALETLGRVDILVHNAGTYPLAPLLEMTDAQWDLVLDTNLRSVHLCTQIGAARLRQQGGGSIVNIATIEAENPAHQHSHYDAAKAAVVMYTRSAARELGPYGIRVNSVSPGLIWREGLDQDWPDGVRRYRHAAPLGRLGTADDVADACLFLASPAARWITGANLVVDGGVMTNTVY